MQAKTALGAGILFASLAFGQQSAPPKTHLKVGDPAPDFSFARTSTGQPFKLAELRGKKTVVVAFFPAAFTGG